MNAHFIKSTYSILAAAVVLASCSSVKPVGKVNNYDDAYFNASDLNGKGFYAQNSMPANAIGEASAKAGSYGQTYSDRLRNFGGSSLQPTHSPAVIVQPCMRFGMGFSPWGGNPFMGNHMMMGSAWGNPWGNPMMMGGQTWNSFNDPYWMYYNQMYNPNMYWGGGSFGGWSNNGFNSGWNNGGGGWNNNTAPNNRPSGGFVNNPKPASGSSGFSNTGARRGNYQTGMPSSSGRSSTPGSYNSGISGPSRSSNWTPSGNTQKGSFNSSGSSRSSNAVQGTSGRRR